jgi:hypothetical protein
MRLARLIDVSSCARLVRSPLTRRQLGVATAFAPSPTPSVVPARVPLHQAQRFIDRCRRVPQSPVLRRHPTSRPAALRQAACPTEITSWILRIPVDLHPQTDRIRSARKNILPHSSATYVRSALPGHTTSGRICALTLTSARSYAVFAARLLPVSTIESDMRACIRVRKSLSAAVI